jgi:hypothetical protein
LTVTFGGEAQDAKDALLDLGNFEVRLGFGELVARSEEAVPEG